MEEKASGRERIHKVRSGRYIVYGRDGVEVGTVVGGRGKWWAMTTAGNRLSPHTTVELAAVALREHASKG